MEDALLRYGFEPAGIDREVRFAAHAPPAVMPVTSQPRRIGDDRVPAPGEPVKQRGFADIGTADDGDDRKHGAITERRWRRPRRCVSAPGNCSRRARWGAP